MLIRQELLQNPDLYRDKARGALIGLAIGDSFGDASRKPENQMAYGFTTDFNKGASWSTDDTEFAMLTAQILIESGGRPTSDCVVVHGLSTWPRRTSSSGAVRANLKPLEICERGCVPRCRAGTMHMGIPTARPCASAPWACCARAISTAPLPWPKLTPPSATTVRASGARSPWPPR